MSQVAITENPEFPWEGLLPEGEFWRSISSNLGISLAKIFSTKELASMTLPAVTESEETKLKALDSIVTAKVASKQAALGSTPLESPDAKPYKQALHALAAIKSAEGQYDEVEKIQLSLLEVPDAKTKLSAVYALAGNAEKEGRLSEAEAYANQSLPMVTEILGDDSPQKIGMMRLMMQIYARQGRYEESWKLYHKATDVVGRMGQGKYGKYQGEEIEALVDAKVMIETSEKEKVAAN